MRPNSRHLLSLVALLLITVLLSSCVLFNTRSSIKSLYTDQEFNEAIQWYKSILSDKLSSTKDKARAHQRLGLLYSHYRNPSLDYEIALGHVEESISLLNSTAPDDSIMNLRALLRGIEGIDVSSTPALRKLSNENTLLKDRNTELSNENAVLRKTLTELNELEVELERRRKEIR